MYFDLRIEKGNEICDNEMKISHKINCQNLEKNFISIVETIMLKIRNLCCVFQIV